MQTQSQQILKHLRSVGDISNIEAQGLYRCRALPKRISELKADGHIIRSVWNKDHTGQRYVRYHYYEHSAY